MSLFNIRSGMAISLSDPGSRYVYRILSDEARKSDRVMRSAPGEFSVGVAASPTIEPEGVLGLSARVEEWISRT